MRIIFSIVDAYSLDSKAITDIIQDNNIKMSIKHNWLIPDLTVTYMQFMRMHS
jgi:hypothetical protein